MACTSSNSLSGCIIAPHAGVHKISMNRCFHITFITFKEFLLYELEPYIDCIEQKSVKYFQKIIYFNWMHDVYLSQQSRLTLLNMLIQFIKKLYIHFYLLLPKDGHSRNSTNENLWFFLFSTQRCAFSKFNKWKSLIFPKIKMVFSKLSPIGYLSMSVCIKTILHFPPAS